MRKSLKFRKDPSFRWGDILLFVTMYDLDRKFLAFPETQKNAILSGKKGTLRIIFFNIFLGRVRPPYVAISGRPTGCSRQKLDCLNNQAYDCLIHFEPPVQTVYTSQHSD